MNIKKGKKTVLYFNWDKFLSDFYNLLSQRFVTEGIISKSKLEILENFLNKKLDDYVIKSFRDL
jgi:predicted Rossmann-fold nucleotide-binding protein